MSRVMQALLKSYVWHNGYKASLKNNEALPPSTPFHSTLVLYYMFELLAWVVTIMVKGSNM